MSDACVYPYRWSQGRTMPKVSASQIQSAEARATPGPGVVAGGTAASAQSLAAREVSHMQSQWAMWNGGSVPKAGEVAMAQSHASHKRQFPASW